MLKKPACIIYGLLLCFFSMAETGTKRASAPLLKGQIVVDGTLDELDWEHAGIIEDLTQQLPHPGQPTAFKTKVYLLRTTKKLYIGIECMDPDPSKIAVHTMARDGNFDGDDFIQLLFDTFDDGRTGFLFGINAAGARQDGLISNAERFSKDWDGIWYARTKIHSGGWSIEIEIPVQTLRFSPGKDMWKMEIKRYVARSRTTFRWAGTSLDSSKYDVRRTGQLSGMADFNQGYGLSISPYALMKFQQDFTEDHTTLKGTPGVDIQYNLTPSMAAVLTINTDFAETEVDNRQINMTRFSLFFPEKRSFFLEGSNQFSFGAGMRSDFIPFYSRRIGLHDGEVVPIDYGLKVVGRQGNLGVALLNVSTRDTEHTKGTNMFAGRVSYDLGHNLQAGCMLTDGDPDGTSKNTLFGIDLLWNTAEFKGDKNFSAGAWFSGVSGDLDPGNKTGWGFLIDYPNDLWDIYFNYKFLGESLNPALGFIPRPGIERYDSGFSFQPRPVGPLSKIVRQFYYEFYTSCIKNLAGDVESWSVFTAPMNFRTPRGAHYEFNIYPRYESITEPFNLSEGVEVPVGDFHFTRYRVEIESSESRPFVASSSVWFGDFYNGSLTQVEASLSWSDSKGKTQFSLETENYFGKMTTGDFIERVYQFKAVYAFNPDLSLSSFTQYDSNSSETATHNRLRWTLSPGRDIFFVFNYGWYREFDRPGSSMTPEYNQITAKLRWTWRK